jgi:hypothetical protein
VPSRHCSTVPSFPCAKNWPGSKTMKKEKEFANILDECLERIIARGETIEQCLASYPEHADELEPLLQTSLFAKKVSAIQPRPEFRERARYQLRAALEEMAQQRERRRFSLFNIFKLQPRWATAVVAVLVILIAGSGTVAAAGNSMPDGALYPVKLATENVRLVLTPSAMGKAELYVKLADKRVAEIIKMADKGKPEQVEKVARRLNAYLTMAAGLAASLEEEAGVVMAPAPESAVQEGAAPPAGKRAPEPEDMEALTVTPVPEAAAEEVPLPAAEEALPEEKGKVKIAPARPVPRQTPALAPAPEKERGPALPGMDGRGRGVEIDPDSKRGRLVASLARRAVEHPEALRAMLKEVPESVIPALLRAIELSDAGYKEALRILIEAEK